MFAVVNRAGDSIGADKVPTIQFWINGFNYNSDFWGSYALSYGGVNRPTVSGSVVFNLSPNDYVSIAAFATGTPSIYSMYFSGFLIG
jgi:hypothetical protein